MPNIKSAKKRVLVTEKKAAQNKMIKSALKTQIKKFMAAVEAGDKETANKLYPDGSRRQGDGKQALSRDGLCHRFRLLQGSSSQEQRGE